MISPLDNQVNTYVSQPQGGDEMDKDAFLELMIAQLQNQDPLDPMDGTEYAAQLAQFTSLEQLTNLNDTMNASIDADYFLTQSINNTLTATLIGNDVKLASPTLNNIGQDSIDFGYNLPADASGVTIEIYNEHGALVRTISEEDTSTGDHKLSWDFFDDNGKKLTTNEEVWDSYCDTVDNPTKPKRTAICGQRPLNNHRLLLPENHAGNRSTG